MREHTAKKWFHFRRTAVSKHALRCEICWAIVAFGDQLDHARYHLKRDELSDRPAFWDGLSVHLHVEKESNEPQRES